MFERFTDRARKVMDLANQQAQRFNHEYIDTEHILLGLVMEGSGVGATVLKNLDVDIKKLRLEVEKLVKRGPDMVVMGKLPQTPRAEKAIEYAIDEARSLNHNYVDTAHVLLGLIREGKGTAAQVLMKVGVKLADARQEMLRLIEAGNEVVRKVIEEAARDGREVLNLRHWEIKSLPAEIGKLSKLKHLLLGDNQLRALPVEIGELAKLERLEVSGNKLTELPAELGRLANMQEFYVSDNQLTRIPAELGKLKKLTRLGLSGNPLESPTAEVVEQGTEAVLAYLREAWERWGREDGGGGYGGKGGGEGEGDDKVFPEDFDTVEDLRIAFEKYLVNEKGYTSKNYSTAQDSDGYAVTRIWDNERKVLALTAFCLERSGADKAFEGIEEYKKKEGISGVPNYVISANDVQARSFGVLEYEADGASYEIYYGDFPSYNELLFVSPLSDRGRRICWALTRLAKDEHGFSVEAPCEDYVNLKIKKNGRTAAQIHRVNDSDENIALALAGYQEDFPDTQPQPLDYLVRGEVEKLSGYTSKSQGERNWLKGNLGHPKLIYEAGVYILRPGSLALGEIENEVSGLLELAKSNAESKGAGDEGEYHAPIAAFSGDGVRDGEGRLVDQLGIEAEVNAMSSLIAARDIKWPLSIGLFGDWGSGKSFFMEMMYDRIKKISGESDRWVEAGNKSDYCRNVVQIRFNAWHYMDSNLWASLVTHIFDELAKEVSSREKVDVEETRKVLFENLESAKKLKDEAEEHEKKAADLKQSAESKLTTVERERAVAENELKRFTARDVVALAKDDPRIQEQCQQIADKLGLEGIGAEAENIRDVVTEANEVFGRVILICKRIATQKNGKLKLIGLTMLILVLPGLVGLVTFKVLPSGWMEQLGGMVFGCVTFFGMLAKTLRPRLNQISKGLAQWEKTQEQILNIGSEKTRAEIELREEIKALKEQENRARQEVEAAEKCVQRAKEELDEIRTGRRLQRLIEEGSRKSEYLEKLGIIAVIRKDFEDLKNLVSESSEQVKSKEFPRIDRIVLYVDDLDRCPSKRVVEVLQAVHLILGFDLFVVVVAVDPRWILHALREEYSAFGGVDEVRARLGRRWLTTPQNYVEKIFQIPFALLRMGDRGYRQLVGKLVESEGRKDRETMGKEQEVMEREGREEQELEREIPQREEKEFRVDEFKPTIEMRPPLANLSAEEVKFMKAMGDLIPSPRAAKRFVNIYRLTLSSVNDGGKLSRLRGTENEPGDYQAVLLMLAILTGFPDQGSDVLKALEDGSETFTGVSDFVKKLKTQEEPNSEPARYHNGVRKGILEAERAVWDRLSKILKERIEELGVRDSLEPFVQWAGWVARFSFQYKPVISEEEGGEEDG